MTHQAIVVARGESALRGQVQAPFGARRLCGAGGHACIDERQHDEKQRAEQPSLRHRPARLNDQHKLLTSRSHTLAFRLLE